MKKSILNLGKALNKAEQKEINGGSTIILCPMEVNNCDCNCYWDDLGRCVQDISKFTTPCG